MSRTPACDVAIIGGGVIGCACAWFLAREGLSVRLYERADVASGASGAAAGMLAPLSESEEGSALREQGLASLARFPQLAEELRELSGVDPEWVAAGLVRVSAHEAGAAELERAAREGAAHGLRWLDEIEVRQLVPGIRPGAVGFHSPHEAHVRSPSLTQAYAGAAAACGAVVVREARVHGLVRDGDRVVGVRTSDGETPSAAVLLAAGPFSPGLLDPDPAAEIPVTPLRGQIVSLDAPSPPFGPILWGDGAYLVPKRNGQLVVGATSEAVGFDRRVTSGGVASLLEAAHDVMPALSGSTFRGAWAGLRPVTPDGLPMVGPVRTLPGLLLATGPSASIVLPKMVTSSWRHTPSWHWANCC